MIYKTTISKNLEGKAIDILTGLSRHSKSRIKHAMNCGAAWLQRPGAKERRLRRATSRLRSGDTIILYYDDVTLGRPAPQVRYIRDLKYYSAWFKPAGLMTQGTRYGDHCALLRQVERHFKPRRRALPVFRIDREASGLVLVAHHRRAAAQLSRMLRDRKIDKTYQIKVQGDLSQRDRKGEIDIDLDQRHALTRYWMLDYDEIKNQSLVRVSIITGRRHQIRRHFESIGYPVMGDPRYGEGNKNREGLQLTAMSLAFQCPFGHGPIEIHLES